MADTAGRVNLILFCLFLSSAPIAFGSYDNSYDLLDGRKKDDINEAAYEVDSEDIFLICPGVNIYYVLAQSALLVIRVLR